jgi:hypothetical protein
MALRRLVGPLVVVALVSLSSPTSAAGSIESQVFGLINGERSSPLIEHSGLLYAARAHSQQMAISGGLNHDGADERVANAQPDPAEGNGAPDDGFATAAWCENVTYSTGFPESQVAGKLYEQWRRSAPHQACMTNSGKNVAAVGIYYDGSTWWATFIAEVDRTPPGGRPAAPPAPRPTTQPAAPAAKPADRAAPAATGEPSAVTPAQSDDRVATGSHEAVSESSVTTAKANAAVSALFDTNPVAKPAPSSAGLARRYDVAVAPLSNFAASFRVNRGNVDVPMPAEITTLAALALIAIRRSARRARIKASWLTANQRVAAMPDRPPPVVRVASPS